MSTQLRVRFQGQDYLLIGDLEQGGALATPEAYAAFECSFAHLYPDGAVMRFGEQIGSREDITVVEAAAEVDTPTVGGLIDALIDPASKGWPDGGGEPL